MNTIEHDPATLTPIAAADITAEQAITELEAAFPTATVFAQRQVQSTFHAWGSLRGERITRIHVSVMTGPDTNPSVAIFDGATFREAVALAIAKGGVQ